MKRLYLFAAVWAVMLPATGCQPDGNIPTDPIVVHDTVTVVLHDTLRISTTDTVIRMDTVVVHSEEMAHQIVELSRWQARSIVPDSVVAAYGIENCFVSQMISDRIFARMEGKSFKSNCTVPRSDLRYLRLLHRNAQGENQLGEMVVSKTIADDVIDIMRQLYASNYKIELMVLVDDFDADDEASMTANNSSCFNFRFMSMSTTKVSKHGLGLAIDINPLYNPYVNGSHIEPAAGVPYADRSKTFPYKITSSDPACRLFIKAGFQWGGNWTSLKDYQHFEK